MTIDDTQIRLVRESLPGIRELLVPASMDFYDNLFALAPELRALFRSDIASQGMRFMVEAMACGTPVIAFPCGSVPEVIDQGVTGFIVRSVEEAVAAVPAAAALNRARVRAIFESRFTIERVAADHLQVYLSLCGQGRPLSPPEALPLSA